MEKGFTLIELLMIITIIAVTTVIGTVFYANTRSQARDSVRKSDLVKLGSALELYAQQNNLTYMDGTPGAEGNCSSSDTTTFYTAIAPYMSDSTPPRDPQTGTNYCYVSVNNGQSFRLFANMENSSNANLTGCSSTYDFSVTSDNITLTCPPP